MSGLQGGADALAGGYLLAAATTKHFLAYQGASSRGTFSPTEVFLSWRDQVDTYEVAWRAVLAQQSAAVMCAYSSLCHDDTNTTCSLPPPAGYGRSHGVPMCANEEMLDGWLRAPGGATADGEWPGMVVGDCGAFQFVQTDHLWADSQEQAAADVLIAGGDWDCSISVGRGFAALLNATADGLVSEANIDRALSRYLAIQFRLGLFDPVDLVPFAQIPMSVVNGPTHRALAAEAARKGVVLLRNGAGVLPLNSSTSKAVLVTGPNANLVASGNYNSQTDLNVTALDGIRAYVPGAAFEPGCVSVGSNSTELIQQAVDAARYSTVVIAAMGLDGSQEYEDSTRTTLSLPGAQDALLSALAATGVPVVLVLFGGSAVVPLPSTLLKMSAVVWAGYGGEEAGTALADVLFGAFSPSGRLPFTFYQSADDLPPYLNMSMTGLPFGRTYRYFVGPEPVFRFGEGNSFGLFALSGLTANATSLSPCDGLRLSVDVAAGAGGPDGDTVVQVYARMRGLALTTPRMALVAYQRVSLAAGAPATALSFDIAPGAFAVVKEDGNATTWWQYPAAVDLVVGEVSPADEAAWSSPLSLSLALGGPPGGTKLSTC